jgi:hypothetical protein
VILVREEPKYIVNPTSTIGNDEPTGTEHINSQWGKSDHSYTITYTKTKTKEKEEKPKYIVDEQQKKYCQTYKKAVLRHFHSKYIQNYQRNNLKANIRDCKYENINEL